MEIIDNFNKGFLIYHCIPYEYATEIFEKCVEELKTNRNNNQQKLSKVKVRYQKY